MAKEKKTVISLHIQPSLLKEVQESANKNSEGNVRGEIRRLIKKSLENERDN